MELWHTTCVIAILFYDSVFSIPFVRQSQTDQSSASSDDSNSKIITNDTMIREFPFSLRSHPYDQNIATSTDDATKNQIDPVQAEQNYRITVAEPQQPHSGEDDNSETSTRRNDSDINVLISVAPQPEAVQVEHPTEPPSAIPPIIMYSIYVSVVVLFVTLLIIIIMVSYIVATTPKEISCDVSGGDDIACIAPRKSKRTAATKKSDDFSSDEDSEQTVDLMERGSGCSNRKGC